MIVKKVLFIIIYFILITCNIYIILKKKCNPELWEGIEDVQVSSVFSITLQVNIIYNFLKTQ